MSTGALGQTYACAFFVSFELAQNIVPGIISTTLLLWYSLLALSGIFGAIAEISQDFCYLFSVHKILQNS